MKKNGTWIALGVFALLLIGVLLTREKNVEVGVKRLETTPFTTAEVTKVELSGSKQALLEKKDGAWHVAEPAAPERIWPVETTQVDALLGAASELKAPDLVTERSDAQPQYEVDDAKGQRVKVSTEKGVVLDVVVGKDAPRGGFYVRRAGDAAVFLGKGALGSTARRGVSDLRRHGLVSIPAGDLRKLVVTPDTGAAYTLVRKDAAGPWVLEGSAPAGFRFDAAAAQRLAQGVAELRADDFLGPGGDDTKLGFAGPHFTLRAEAEGGKTLLVHVGRKEPAKDAVAMVPVRVEGDPETYLLSAWRGEQLRKPLEGLRDLSLVALDVAKAREVRITAGKERVVLSKGTGGWVVKEPKKLPAGRSFDAAQVDARLSEWSRWRAKAVSTRPAAGLEKPAALLEVKSEDGKVQSLRIGAQVPGSSDARFAKGAVDAAVYEVPDAFQTTLERGLALFDKPPPPRPGGGMSGLESLPPEVRRKLEEQLGSAQR